MLLSLALWLFFRGWHPEWMSFQEQNQLLPLTGDYLCERLGVAGGLADWTGEFIVQFFYVKWLGALLMALLLTLVYWLGVKALTPPQALKGRGRCGVCKILILILPLILPLAILWLLGDENVLVSLVVAVALVLGAVALMRRTRWLWWPLVVVALWWAVGTSWSPYYRIPQHGPQLSGWDKDKWELLRHDYLIRHERWADIMERAAKHQVHTPFWSNSVNLALAMRGELAQRQFDFWQSGEQALMMPMVRDNVTNLPTMEAFWRLGMVNEALRYASDLQESILNARRSGRLEQRIVECLVVNGQYDIARKHLRLLKKSLFYSHWAEETEQLLNNETAIAAHPVYGRLRQLRYRDNFLYSYPEMDKMLGLLVMNNTTNKLALEYWLAQLLLKGDAQTFMQALPWAQQYGGYAEMPRVYQDAVQCIQSDQLTDSPYGRYVKQMMGGGLQP